MREKPRYVADNNSSAEESISQSATHSHQPDELILDEKSNEFLTKQDIEANQPITQKIRQRIKSAISSLIKTTLNRSTRL